MSGTHRSDASIVVDEACLVAHHHGVHRQPGAQPHGVVAGGRTLYIKEDLSNVVDLRKIEFYDGQSSAAVVRIEETNIARLCDNAAAQRTTKAPAASGRAA